MCVLRYALVDFGLAQGTPDTQIELLKVVKAQKESHGKQALIPLPPHTSTKALPAKRPCPNPRTKHSKVSVSVWGTRFLFRFGVKTHRLFFITAAWRSNPSVNSCKRPKIWNIHAEILREVPFRAASKLHSFLCGRVGVPLSSLSIFHSFYYCAISRELQKWLFYYLWLTSSYYYYYYIIYRLYSPT